MAPRGTQEPPKGPHDAPKTPPKTSSTHPKTHHYAFHAAPDAPKRSKTQPTRTETFQMKRASRLLLLRFLESDQKVSKNLGFYRVFGSSGLRKSAKKEAAQKMCPKRPPRRFLGPKSGPKRPPGGPQETPQEAPRRPQDAPKKGRSWDESGSIQGCSGMIQV